MSPTASEKRTPYITPLTITILDFIGSTREGLPPPFPRSPRESPLIKSIMSEEAAKEMPIATIAGKYWYHVE
jgi:hypothetical protein